MKSKREDASKNGDQPLWDLLGNTGEVGVSPLFSRNVVRKVRQIDDKPKGLFSWLARPLVFQAAAVISFAGIALLVVSQPNSSGVATSLSKEVVVDFELTAELDSMIELGELMAVADPTTLNDEALLNLLY